MRQRCRMASVPVAAHIRHEGNDVTDELWQWDAVALAEGIRTRAISSREAVSACVERMRAVNPQLNAVTCDLSVEALAAADRADAAVAAGRKTQMRWVRCTASRSRSRRTSTRKAARRSTASRRTRTSSPRPTARSSPTGRRPARSSSGAPTRRRSASGSTRSTTIAAARTARGRARIRPAARAAARRRRWRRASRRSRTATTSPVRCAIRRIAPGSRDCGPRSAASPRTTRRAKPSASSPRS